MTSLLAIQYATLPAERNILTVKKSNNRLAYVDALVDANALVIESIWKIPKMNTSSVVPLRTFIQEVLKRSRTTYSTLQTALFYLFRSRPEIKLHIERMQQQQSKWDAYVSCGRRMFLASLVVASKFVQDKTYRNSAWAKIAGLPVSEINAAERIFLNIIDYRLYISQPTFEKWHHLLHLHVEAKTLNQPNNLQDFSNLAFAPVQLQDNSYSPTHSIDNSPVTPTCSPPHPKHHPPRWTLVLSPTNFLPPPVNEKNNRKRPYCYNYPLPVLSMSLPSSINSSPMLTPTQISPVRMNGQSVFHWSPMNNNNSNKKRKLTLDNTTRSYNISHVRQQSKRFHP
ncbi:hypothetical protein INT47_010885 [Mucor saturninus]|uniref:Cyclin-domain-containing protein n=1 Tax=Mucor saturninus TaxID=64648 RepID=A0A8H7RE15_9FUNG|nr:hypothetical protein INT47_010885 [Mucor saturninus]